MTDPIDPIDKPKHTDMSAIPEGAAPTQQDLCAAALKCANDVIEPAQHTEGQITTDNYNLVLHHLNAIHTSDNVPADTKDKIAGLIHELKGSTSADQDSMVYISVDVGGKIIRELENLS